MKDMQLGCVVCCIAKQLSEWRGADGQGTNVNVNVNVGVGVGVRAYGCVCGLVLWHEQANKLSSRVLLRCVVARIAATLRGADKATP